MHLVFVYGTLKSGYHNHKIINTRKGFKATVKGINLHKGYAFPYATIGEGTAIGEAYWVSNKELEQLDWLEGIPYHYQRIETKINDLDGNEFTGWIYISPENAIKYPLIQSGEWLEGLH